MSTDVLEGLDAPESEIGTEPPQVTEPKVDPAPEPDKARADDGKFKGKEPPEKKAEAKEKEPEKAKDEPKTIPMAAYLEDRNRHRAEIEELRKQHQATMAELEKIKNPPKPPPAEPDFTADPKTYVDTKVGAVLKQLETGTTELKKTTEEARQEAAFTRFQQQLTNTEQQFVTQTPDYYDSLKHLRELRFQELAILNPGVEAQQIIDAIKREEVQLAWQHMHAGRDPHAVAYQLAKARGYAPKPPAQANDISNVLPHVPTQKQLPPDQTLGSGSGTPDASGETFLDDDEVFEAAFNQMFGRKRA